MEKKMEISVDISLYPLKEDYVELILAFIDAVEKYQNIEVIKNHLSTQIYGEYHTVMSILEKEVLGIIKEVPNSVFVIKIVGNNRLKGSIDD